MWGLGKLTVGGGSCRAHEELETLKRLAEKSDAGDQTASKVLKGLVLDILLDGNRTPRG
jgi:hypothetical protein